MKIKVGNCVHEFIAKAPWVFKGTAKGCGWGSVPEDITRHQPHAHSLQKRFKKLGAPL